MHQRGSVLSAWSHGAPQRDASTPRQPGTGQVGSGPAAPVQARTHACPPPGPTSREPERRAVASREPERPPPLWGSPASPRSSPQTCARPGPASSPKGHPGHCHLPGLPSRLADSFPPPPHPPQPPPPARLKPPVSVLRGLPPTLGIPSRPQSKGLSTLGAQAGATEDPQVGMRRLGKGGPGSESSQPPGRSGSRQGRRRRCPLAQLGRHWVRGRLARHSAGTGPPVPHGAQVGNGDRGHGYPPRGPLEPSRTSSFGFTASTPTFPTWSQE